jgi:hypothetical protein
MPSTRSGEQRPVAQAFKTLVVWQICQLAGFLVGDRRSLTFVAVDLGALAAALELTRDRDRTIFWFRNAPIPEFRHRTAEQLVAEGKSDAIVSYLNSIASG